MTDGRPPLLLLRDELDAADRERRERWRAINVATLALTIGILLFGVLTAIL